MRGKQGRKKKAYRRTPSGKTKIYFKKRKHSSCASCALCSKKLAGVSNERNLSKSEKRPSAIFGGVLCNKCRKTVIEEAIKVKQGIKRLEDCEVRLRGYIEQSLKLLE
ncbi:MAG: 50S ribosomal protein L34e [Candidatus Diapherotrites archaeon]|nr:50S ribosomal protein L34e [Candidatus Diapherotrites archaeon]